MWIKETGEIGDRLVFLGTHKTTMYLVKADRYMLIGGGGQWMVPELDRQIREYGIEMDRVAYVWVSHSHYDHCGAVPYLRKRYPWIQVLASRGVAEIFGMEKALKNMRTFSCKVMESMGLSMEYDGVSLGFDEMPVHRSLREGDQIDLGNDVRFDVYETPGHSRCAATLYEASRKWLFPGDSLCFPVGDGSEFLSTASESFIQYIKSLKKLEPLEVSLCGWEHYGAVTGVDAKDLLGRGIRSTLAFKRFIQEEIEGEKDPDAVAHRMARDWLDKSGFTFLPDEVMFYISRGMIKNALQEKVD